MSYYTTCETCGACLDPGESCDCEVKPIKGQMSKSTKATPAGKRREAIKRVNMHRAHAQQQRNTMIY
jgi:hypothetical protein